MDFEQYYKENNEALLYLAARLMRMSIENPDVKDLCSRTWTKVFKNWDKYVGSDEGRMAWVYTIMANTRKDDFKTFTSKHIHFGIQPFQYPAIHSRETDSDIYVILDGLLFADQLLYYMKAKGMTTKEIHEIVDVPVNSINVYWKQICDYIRVKLAFTDIL